MSGSGKGFAHLIGAYVSAGDSFQFGESVREGVAELEQRVKQVSAACPATKFVLGGYSQGAMVVMQSLDHLDADRIIYVSTFGDPKLYLPEGQGSTPDACLGRNLSPYRAYVSDCHAYQGVLGALKPYETARYAHKIGTWCNARDIMCSSGMSIRNHSEYVERGLYQHAAALTARKIQATFPNQTSGLTPSRRQVPHDLVIVIHIGYAMKDTFHTYRAAAERLANQIRSLGGRVALYAYIDSKYLIPRKLCDFTCTADEFNAALRDIPNFSFGAAGESYNSALSALKVSMNSLNWQYGATKSAVVLTPTRYNPTDRDGTTLQDIVDLSLSIDPVNVYALTTPTALSHNSKIAQATNGRAYTIDQIDLAIPEISQRPLVSLTLEEYQGLVHQPITFDTQATTLDSASSSSLHYDWDLDADGTFEYLDSGSVMTKSYSSPISGFIQVRVSDQSGHQSTMSARLEVTSTPALWPRLDSVQVTSLDSSSFKIHASGILDGAIISINDMPYGLIDRESDFSFILQDVTKTTEIQLTPHLDGTKGTPETITLRPETNSDQDSFQSSSQDSTQNPNQDFGQNSSQDSSQDSDQDSYLTSRPNLPQNHPGQLITNPSPSSPNGNQTTTTLPSAALRYPFQIAPALAEDFSNYTPPSYLIPKAPNTGYFTSGSAESGRHMVAPSR